MLTTGLLLAVAIIAALTLVAILGRGGGGPSAILLGAGGVAYAVARYPERILIVVFPLSVLFIVVGGVAVTRQYVSRRSKERAHR